MGQKNPESSAGGAELRPKRRLARNIWFNPGLNLGPHPPWAGDRPKNHLNGELPEKLLTTTTQRKKVAQQFLKNS